jgi:uncharacterized protein (UPF0335 family)
VQHGSGFLPKIIKEIIDDYNSGIRENKIVRQYKIPRGQFIKIIRDYLRMIMLKKERLEKEKLIISRLKIPVLYK